MNRSARNSFIKCYVVNRKSFVCTLSLCRNEEKTAERAKRWRGKKFATTAAAAAAVNEQTNIQRRKKHQTHEIYEWKLKRNRCKAHTPCVFAAAKYTAPLPSSSMGDRQRRRLTIKFQRLCSNMKSRFVYLYTQHNTLKYSSRQSR